MGHRIDISLKENKEFATYLHEQLKEYNNQHSPYHKQSRQKGAVKPVYAIVLGENGEWLGGMVANIYWNWLELEDFWLDESVRGKGMGSALLAQVEQMGRENGVERVLLTTFEFQARAFYERYGYKVVGVIEDYPPGFEHYTMVKVF